MYSVYFDDILQRPEDIININDVMETSIVRQDGFDSQQQIIREKSDATLEFTGQAYSYVCNILKKNSCHVFNVRIEETCGYIYNATMSIVGMEMDLHKCICKTDLKDNSFSAYIDGYLNTNVSLFNVKTKNCEVLNPIVTQFKMPYDVTNISLLKTINGFDVLDVFQFIISYYTDNTISVVSDYLTTNKYAITTGFSMHNHGFSIKEKYPEISFNDLFKELRKKLALYMAIEYDDLGNPYLRIEEENYFFADVELFSIDEIPRNVIQTYDNKRNFNVVNIGSNKTEALEDSPITYPQLRYTAWNEESYGKCGSCVGEKDSELDLVSDYIIDSNIIVEALIFDVDTDYDHDNDIFLFNYYMDSVDATGKMTLNSLTGNYYYNDSLRNENVLANFLQYYRECLEVQRQSSYGFLATKGSQTMNVTDVLGFVQNYIQWSGSEYFIDNQDSLSNVTHDFGAGADSLTIFTCALANEYNFKSQALNILQRYSTPIGANNPTLNVTYTLYIKIYSDNTFTTLLNTYSETGFTANAKTTSVDLTVTTGLVALSVGNVVCCELTVSYPIGSNTGDVVVFEPNLMSFELLDDSDSCLTINTGEDTKPYELTFDYKLCFEQYNIANLNKKGYINVGGFPHWIKELRYKHGGISSFSLMSNQLLCSCT
ncbi:MAG TPA: hypothetical protein PLS10_08770 [Chitinophagales bacterium]|nr:hypothetical protein [Chitinophagales bacterium]